MRRVDVKTWLLGGVSLLLAVVAAMVHSGETIELFSARVLKHPILFDSTNADWIMPPYEFHLKLNSEKPYTVIYRTEIPAEHDMRRLTLKIRALRQCVVFVDGLEVARAAGVPPGRLVSIAVPIRIEGDRATIEISVTNHCGPPLLKCQAEGWPSGLDWIVMREGDPPGKTIRAADFQETCVRLQTATVVEALGKSMGVLITGAAFGLSIVGLRRKLSTRWVEVATLATYLLFATGISLLLRNSSFGYDGLLHVEYMDFILENGALPTAFDGLQMFQPPLYHFLSVIPAFVLGDQAAPTAGRLISLLSGAFLIHGAFQLSRIFFPNDRDKQVLSGALCGSMPMIYYMSPMQTNEVLAGALLFYSCLFAIQIEPTRRRYAYWSIALLGLSIMTKVTAMLVAPVVLLAVALALKKAHEPRPVTTSMALLLIFSVLAGWHFVFQAFATGSFFVGGWDARPGMVWWQFPGFRIWSHFLTFGGVFDRPMYSGTNSFWDSFYGNAWTDIFNSGRTTLRKMGWERWPIGLVALVGISIPFSIAFVIGFVKLVYRGLVMWSVKILLYPTVFGGLAAAYVALYAVLPIYSTGKTSYLIALVPFGSVCIAHGFSPLQRYAGGRMFVHAITGVLIALVFWTFVAWPWRRVFGWLEPG